MPFDPFTLFLAAGISCLALAATLLIAWTSARTERFVLTWSIGVFVLAGGATGSMLSNSLDLGWIIACGYCLDLVGFTIVYVAATQFTTGRAHWRLAVLIGCTGLALVLVPFGLGLAGLGTMMLNFVSALLLLMTALTYWRDRAEAPVSLMGISALYGLTALSFLACAIELLRTHPLTLRGAPDNWAEQANAIMCLIGITGIGALSLALNQARAARRHRDASRTDALTGLRNRRALFDDFSSAPMEPATAVVIFDLDGFKSINDIYGHAIGDEVLRRFARALRENLTARDYGARLGGEEFALVLRRATPDLAMLCAERIRALFETESIPTAKGALRATVSAGVACTLPGGEAFDAMLRRADGALYAAKSSGRNRVVSPGLTLAA